jgi:hypothetical protein
MAATRSVIRAESHMEGEVVMLWAIVVILLILWLLGFAVVHVAGGFIHLLLIIALIVLVIQLVSGRRAV